MLTYFYTWDIALSDDVASNLSADLVDASKRPDHCFQSWNISNDLSARAAALRMLSEGQNNADEDVSIFLDDGIPVDASGFS